MLRIYIIVIIIILSGCVSRSCHYSYHKKTRDPMQKIEIYTTKICPYCIKAKALLDKKGVSYHEIKVDGNDDLRQQLVTKSGGRKTVPQIFIGDQHIGGCDDLYALDKDGGLDPLLQ
jgi:glutaredoxin 3